jgi:aryl-alcohol dehydrogenase-like predicted oxidoreductase
MDYRHLGRSGVSVSRHGIGVIPWSPLHGGLLSGVLRRQGAGPSGGRSSAGRAAEAIQEIRPQIEAYEAFCADLGEDPAVVALAWLLHQPAVTAPIVGPRTLDQLTGALRALEVTLDEKALGRLDEIFPGPGGTAPEAYAW